ncbi:Response regulator containing a CheY-like receiver domain and an HTH DNA-binding domain [Hyella patelloides LEGE 07179]|uniref:Response regulator containing a CheY-like receiver domain and an HTH DNA-binding domain n=1 Tax=Hyella patelloides LEGE 07179 TaxID=945734 RepID=A0A563VM58_9CYAN|nr:LuxR C-terminal-related transcriptional regulator [Hyella patelloides]VEP12447.1 Response regulator containing a CheY-like receiver domain and an HTH DNA-binding domain [Hyella patelloides LEGE 07179]
MKDSLKSLFEAIAKTESEKQLHLDVIGQIGSYFAAKRYQLFLLDRLPYIIKKSQTFQLASLLDRNPVIRYLMEHHAPIHEGVLLSTEKWRTLCPRFDHGHVMVGPIVNDGNLIGALGLTRDRNSESFNSQNIAEMSALCLHLSICFAKIQSQKIELTSSNIKLITPREVQIAELVAQGLTNAEIGKNLWITENSVKKALKRMFRKLKVSSRTEMIAKLSN